MGPAYIYIDAFDNRRFFRFYDRNGNGTSLVDPLGRTTTYSYDNLDRLTGLGFTDGTASTMNGDDRWPNVLSRRLKAIHGNKVAVVNGGIGGNQIAGPAVVVGYTMARTLMRLIIQLGITCSNALTPEISRLAGRGEFEQARRFTQRASSLVLGLCVLVLCVPAQISTESPDGDTEAMAFKGSICA